jgi:hypothetical protein
MAKVSLSSQQMNKMMGMISNVVRVKEKKVLELIVINFPAFFLVEFLENGVEQSLLCWNLEFGEHHMKLLPVEGSAPIDIELVKHSLQDILLMGSAGHLDQLEPHNPQCFLDFLLSEGWLGFVLEFPLGTHKACEGLITGNVETEIVVEVDELLSGDETFSSQGDQTEHLLFNPLFSFLF